MAKKALVWKEDYQGKVADDIERIGDASEIDSWTHHLKSKMIIIDMPTELESEDIRFLEVVDVPEVVAVEGVTEHWTKDELTSYSLPMTEEHWTKEGESDQYSLPMTIEYWSKEGESDVYEDPQDETWTHHPQVEDTSWTHVPSVEDTSWTHHPEVIAVQGVPAHKGIQLKATAASDKAQEAVHKAVRAAMDFGSSLITDFAAENILLGITSDGMTKTVRQHMSEIILALQTGSLYDAIDEIDNFPAENKDAKYITDARLQEYKDKITTFLGV